jgi:hypothetical protein
MLPNPNRDGKKKKKKITALMSVGLPPAARGRGRAAQSPFSASGVTALEKLPPRTRVSSRWPGRVCAGERMTSPVAASRVIE